MVLDDESISELNATLAEKVVFGPTVMLSAEIVTFDVMFVFVPVMFKLAPVIVVFDEISVLVPATVVFDVICVFVTAIDVLSPEI